MSNKKMFVSSVILFLIGALLHFAYEFLGNNFIVGLITPVNESVAEHLKLAIIPIFSWWLIYYLLKNKKYNLDKEKWFLGCLVSMIVSIIIILGIHYFIKYGLDTNSFVIDIVLLYISILIGQLIGYHVYKFSRKTNFNLSISMILFIIFSLIVFTIYPPKVPLFEDTNNNTYGINKEVKE